MFRFKYYLKSVLELLFFAGTAALLTYLLVYKESELRGKARVIYSQLNASDVSSEPLVYDLNAASEWELQNINGIGEATARAIVEYRGEHGGFSSADELVNVRGIGQVTFEKIRPYLYVSEEDRNAD